MENQGGGTVTGTLRHLGSSLFHYRSGHVASVGHRLHDLIVGDCNNRVVVPNMPERALLTSLDVDATVRG